MGLIGLILILIGLYTAPIFTISMILFYFDENFIGLVVLIISIFVGISDKDV